MTGNPGKFSWILENSSKVSEISLIEEYHIMSHLVSIIEMTVHKQTSKQSSIQTLQWEDTLLCFQQARLNKFISDKREESISLIDISYNAVGLKKQWIQDIDASTSIDTNWIARLQKHIFTYSLSDECCQTIWQFTTFIKRKKHLYTYCKKQLILQKGL